MHSVRIPRASGPCGTSESAIERLEAYSWPGNVRELENAIRRALVLSTGGVLTADDFDFLTESPDTSTLAAALEDVGRRPQLRKMLRAPPRDPATLSDEELQLGGGL